MKRSGLCTSAFVVVALLTACSGDSGTNAPALPVESVTISGASRIKVGDAYHYTATVRLSDNSVSTTPVTWASPVATANGTVTAATTGALTISASAGGVTGTLSVTAYDWVSFSDATTLGIMLYSDASVTNRFGTPDYPYIIAGCTTGTLVLGVAMDNIITADGNVTYSIGAASAVPAVWLETEGFHSLAYPGTGTSVKTFLNQMAGATAFGFTFGEYLAATRSTTFRTTGLTQKLSAIYAACPVTLRGTSTDVLSDDAALDQLVRAFQAQR